MRGLVLAYGISETKIPALSWPKGDDRKTVESYLLVNFDRKPERYGQSLVDTAFQVPDELDVPKLSTRLDAVIDEYAKALGADPIIVAEPDETSKEEFSIDDAV